MPRTPNPAMSVEPQRAELLARVAHLYFEKGDDQSAIARRLRVSRSSVSRLLTQAREQGIVEIRIHYPLSLDHALGDALSQRFRLKDALVLRTAQGEHEVKSQVARLAARYLEKHLTSNDVVAISRGSTLHAVIEHCTPIGRPNVRVVQLVGSLRVPGSPEDDANLAKALAEKLDGEYYNLNAPLFVENVETRRVLLEEPAIRHVLDMASRADIALVGIGTLDRQSSAIVSQKLLAPAQLDQLRKQHVVGEICSQFYDSDGIVVATALTDRTIALELDVLRASPCVIGVATGVHKAKAMRGAMRGGYIHVVITDDQTAARILELDHSTEPLLHKPIT